MYAAGVFDAEGCITPTIWRSGHGPVYGLRVVVSNTDPRLKQWLSGRFSGACIGTQTSGRKRPCYDWLVQWDAAREFLISVLPYSRVKADQARVAIEFLDYVRGNRKRTPEALGVRQMYHDALKDLKRTVIDDSPSPGQAIEFPYLAGILDGDGNVSICGPQLMVKVTNTNLPVLLRIRETFGGTVGEKKTHQKDGYVRRRCWHWYMYRKEAAQLLVAMMPYLVLKKEQARIATDFELRRTRHSGSEVPADVAEFRNRCKSEIEALNRGEVLT